MPVPTIFLINGDNQIVEMKDEPYDSEDRLQKLLADFPSVLAGDQMNAAIPLRWLLIKREAGIPGEQGGFEKWSLDHLFIDQYGVPTLVEVKRSTNTEIRRDVVGQMMDYAANAVVYWPVETIRQWFEETCAQQGCEATSRLAALLGVDDPDDEATSRFWETVEVNLRGGKLRLVFAADAIPPELRRIIEFLDERMTPTEVIGIEIRQYVGTGVKTLVPNVIRSSKKDKAKVSSTPGVKWDEPRFLDDLSQRSGQEAVVVAKQIMEWATKQNVITWWGQGKIDGSWYVGQKLRGVSYYPIALLSWGVVQMQFGTLVQRGVPANVIKEFVLSLNTLPNVYIKDERLDKYPSFQMTALKDQDMMSRFLKALSDFFAAIREHADHVEVTPGEAATAVEVSV